IDLNASQQLSDQAKLKSARRFLDLACARDEAFACSMLGKLLEHEYGGPADAKRATAVLDKAKGVYARRCSLDEKPGKRDGEVCWQFGYVIEMGYGMD